MKRRYPMYLFRSEKIPERMRLAVASDLHAGPYREEIDVFLSCDALLLPGDLLDRHRRNNSRAEAFLKEVPDRLPVYYAMGNHEVRYPRPWEFDAFLAQSRVHVLDNNSCYFRGIRIGGLSSPPKGKDPDTGFLDRFAAEEEYKILMCHHPELYGPFVQGRNIDLTLCGHAHGGQIQICGRGLYAPGQGLFPKLTHGFHDGGKMLISRGMTNAALPRVPRINNPCELIILELAPMEEQ